VVVLCGESGIGGCGGRQRGITFALVVASAAAVVVL